MEGRAGRARPRLHFCFPSCPPLVYFVSFLSPLSFRLFTFVSFLLPLSFVLFFSFRRLGRQEKGEPYYDRLCQSGAGG